MTRHLLFAVLFCCLLITCSSKKHLHKNLYTDVLTEHVFTDSTFLNTTRDSLIIIDQPIDLKGNILIIPDNHTLYFKKHGSINNGLIIGNNTRIDGNKVGVLSQVKIEGTWNVPNISTNLFCDLTYINSLKDVFALASDAVNNTIIIEKGDYYLELEEGQLAVLCPKSNTRIINNGIISLLPTNKDRHYVLWCNNVENVTIKGGKIIGDRNNHQGRTGEWGYGICATRTSNLEIIGVEVCNCWGDCICLGVDNSNVLISGCKLHDSRRQGITVAGRENIKINKCRIYNIKGTEPQSAIDIEPDAYGKIKNVDISDIEIKNCKVGIQAYGGAKNVEITNIKIDNVKVSSLFDCNNAFYFAFVDSIYLNKCYVRSIRASCFRFEDCKGEIKLNNNRCTSVVGASVINTSNIPIKLKRNKLSGDVKGLFVEQ